MRDPDITHTELETPTSSQRATSAQQERLDEFLARRDAIQQRIKALRCYDQEVALLEQATRSTTAAKRVLWLRRAADALVRSVAPVVPCRRGCAGCCHQPVQVSEAEARLIAAENRLHLNENAGKPLPTQPDPWATGASSVAKSIHTDARPFAKNDAYAGTPCPFLQDGDCAIYSTRPTTCRVLMSVDRDEFLCQIVPGQHVMAPYIDARLHNIAYAACCGEQSKWADLREWFPAGPAILG